MLDKENASFECTGNDVPAQIEVNQDTPVLISANFPTSLLGQPETPSITVRRGAEVLPERVDRTLTGFRNDDWSMTVTGKINFCVGPARLQVMQGNFDVSAHLGKYTGDILSTDTVRQGLHIEYKVNTSGTELIHAFYADGEDHPPYMNAQFVGPASDGEARILGRFDFVEDQLSVKFTGPSDLEGVTHHTSLNVTLILVEASSE
ncbi:hypothetical protein [Loktanella sp. D2R18]|uniref:hypothetical protein n=2 Tax=Rhodobacterales TaxID=204455 RepID=UPI0011BF69AD|nr:hypothetical protein [Loktanella sp. D2R18]MDO6592092.1 hypothetical protein [Yoonia sp. 1_MG-2023]